MSGISSANTFPVMVSGKLSDICGIEMMVSEATENAEFLKMDVANLHKYISADMQSTQPWADRVRALKNNLSILAGVRSPADVRNSVKTINVVLTILAALDKEAPAERLARAHMRASASVSSLSSISSSSTSSSSMPSRLPLSPAPTSLSSRYSEGDRKIKLEEFSSQQSSRPVVKTEPKLNFEVLSSGELFDKFGQPMQVAFMEKDMGKIHEKINELFGCLSSMPKFFKDEAIDKLEVQVKFFKEKGGSIPHMYEFMINGMCTRMQQMDVNSKLQKIMMSMGQGLGDL